MKRMLIICIVLLWCENAHAAGERFLRAFGEVMPAPAVQAMCDAFPHECVPAPDMLLVDLTPEKREELDRVNREVNDAIVYRTDESLYGVDEKWTLDEKQGDCEEYAAMKRHRLMGLGWPASALLITVVKGGDDPTLHALLTARTSKGDLILDSKLKDGSTRIWWWHQIPYIYVAQQSPKDPRRWVSLIPLPNNVPQFERWVTSR